MSNCKRQFVVTFSSRDLGGDLEDIFAVHSDTIGITTIGQTTAAILESVIVGECLLLAHLIESSLAIVAITTGIDHGTGADEVADLVVAVFALCNDLSDNLVARNTRSVLQLAPTAGDGVDIGTADTAMGDLNLNVLGPNRARVVAPLLQVGGSSRSPAVEGDGGIFGSFDVGRHC